MFNSIEVKKMKVCELEVQKVQQPIGEFYIAKIDHKILYSMAKADIMRISKDEDNNSIYDGIQRELNPKKVEKIKNYLSSEDATFPNSVILNLNKENLLGIENGILKVRVSENTFSILDGQHRLEGLSTYNGKFQLSCSIFIGLNKIEQSRIFITINSEQTKVNPSVSVYQEYEDKFLTPRKFAAEIAIAFATDKKSKWFQKIKIRGFKDEISEQGIISLSAFYKPILDLIYNDEEYYYQIRNTLQKNKNNLEDLGDDFHLSLKFNDSNKYILWDLYIKFKIELLYKILNNYFESVAEVLNLDWNNDKSILTKTTGYNALMMLFKDLYLIGLKKKTLNKEFFMEHISKLESLNGKINSKNFDSSGQQSAKNLYLEFSKLMSMKNIFIV